MTTIHHWIPLVALLFGGTVNAEQQTQRPVIGKPYRGVIGKPYKGMIGKPYKGVIGKPYKGVIGKPYRGKIKLKTGHGFKAYTPTKAQREHARKQLENNKRWLQKAQEKYDREGAKLHAKYPYGGAGHYEGFQHRQAQKEIKLYKQGIKTWEKELRK